MSKYFLRLATVACGVYLAGVLHAAEFQVTTADDAVDRDLNDGRCLTALGLCSLRAAVEQANRTPGSDTIVLPPNNYRLTVGGVGEAAAHTGDLDISDDLEIAGTDTATTIIDARRLDRIFQVLLNTQVSIHHVTLTNGNAITYQGVYDRDGGCISNQGDLTLHNVNFTNCSSVGNGGGLSNAGGVDIDTVVFSGNNAGADVGGGASSAGTATIRNTTFSNNKTAKYGSGGGLQQSGTITLTNVIFEDNQASYGGGLASSAGTLTMKGATIRRNSADIGGGLALYYSILAVIDNTTIEQNTAIDADGGVSTSVSFNAFPELYFNHVRVINNSAPVAGGLYLAGNSVFENGEISRNNATQGNAGGVQLEGGATFYNTLITNNRAHQGGGIYNDGTMIATNTTISGNVADNGNGGGLFLTGASDTTRLTNVTLARNSAVGRGGNVSKESPLASSYLVELRAQNTVFVDPIQGGNCNATIISLGNNLDTDNSCGLTQSSDKPLITAGSVIELLANNGGSTLTHALKPSSPALNAANNTACTLLDQRRFARHLASNTSANLCDMGAIEMGATPINSSQIQLTQTSLRLNESAGLVNLTVSRTGTGTGRVGVRYRTDRGTANIPLNAGFGSLEWADGDTADKTITIPFTSSTLPETNKRFFVYLYQPTNGAEVDISTRAEVVLLDDECQPCFGLDNVSLVNAGNQSFQENAGTVTWRVLGINTETGGSVNYSTFDISAINGIDYRVTSGNLSFLPGQRYAEFPITIIEDTLAEPTELFRVDLANPSNGATISNPSIAYAIFDNDGGAQPNPGVLRFSSSQQSVNEAGANLTLTIERSGGADGILSAHISQPGGSANLGSDYQLPATFLQTLAFGPGVTSRTVVVPIIDDLVVETNETITFSLTRQSGEPALGTPASTSVTIIDNDLPPVDNPSTPNNGATNESNQSSSGAFDPLWLLLLLEGLFHRRRATNYRFWH